MKLKTEAAQIVSGKGLTVRDTENLVRRLLEPTKEKVLIKENPDVQRLQTELSENLGAPVSIAHNAKGKGKLVINFSSLDQLDGILGHIK